MDTKNLKIIEFLEGKTIKSIFRESLNCGIDITFTDGSNIDINPVLDDGLSLLEYTLDGVII